VSGLVHHLERIERCQQPLRDFFGWWNLHGLFPITIPPEGGVREDEAEQAEFFALGVSGAKTLDDTPHGPAHRAAVDAYPAILGRNGRVVRILTDVRNPHVLARFTAYGLKAMHHGLEWGGLWSRRDYPHVEVPNWRTK
jgi:hypothetical protein